MFDIAWTEMLVLAVITIVVVGPRDLPKVMRAVGNMVSKARALAGKFQSDMDQLARETELEELRKQARAYQAKFRNPMGDLDKLIDPTTGEEIEKKGPAAESSKSTREPAPSSTEDAGAAPSGADASPPEAVAGETPKTADGDLEPEANRG